MRRSCTRLFAVNGELRSKSSAEALLESVPLGISTHRLVATIGTPWLVAREDGATYSSYSVDESRAWLVVRATGTIQSVTLVPQPYCHPTLRIFGMLLGAANKQYTGDRRNAATFPRLSIGNRTYGVHRAKNGEIASFVKAKDSAPAVPALIRWYELTGWSPDRAIPEKLYGVGKLREESFLSKTNDRVLRCIGANSWRVRSRKTFTYGGASVDAVYAQCGKSALFRTVYFDTTPSIPVPYAADPIAQRILSGEATASAVRDATLTHQMSAKIRSGGTTGQIWFTTPNLERCNSSGGTSCDTFLSYIDDPSNPLQSVTLVPAVLSPDSGLVKYGYHSRVRATSVSCSFASGQVKCGQGTPPDGASCDNAKAQFGGFTVTIGPNCFTAAGDPLNFPHPPHAGGSSGCSGHPIDAVNGTLSYEQSDANLSGPSGLFLFHRYDSQFSQYQGDLGIGWRHSYGDYLDTSELGAGLVTYHRNDCAQEYFQSVGSGSVSYDPNSGDSLTTNDDGSFTLVTWQKRTLTFTSIGRLTSISDRVGNVTTINRNSAGAISSVVDPLGRQLTFSTDSENRITSITSSPSGVNLSFSYDSGTNCYTGDLCTSTESDGEVWTYQYYDPATYGGNHLLEYVIDPLGHIAEYDTYQLINLGNGDYHYRIIHQEQQGSVNARNYSYSIGGAGGTTGTTTVTDALGSSHTTTYVWDQLLQQVTSVTGPLCACHGDQLSFTFDNFDRLLTVVENGLNTFTTSSYGRDVIFTSPDGATSYTQIAYPGATATTQYGLSTQKGVVNTTTQTAYYAIGDPRQDLPNVVTQPSVEKTGDVAQTTLSYSTSGLLQSVTRAGYVNGTATSYTTHATYDSKGRLLTSVGPRTDVDQTTTYAYYSDTDSDLARRGQLDTITDALGHVTTMASAPSPYNTYSLYGEPASVTDPNGVVTDYSYDARGRLLTRTLKGVTGDPLDLVTQFTYDALGKLTALQKPLGNEIQNTYDGANNLTSMVTVDSAGNQHDQLSFSYDAISRLQGKTAASCTTPSATCGTWSQTFSTTLDYTSLDLLSDLSYPAGGSTSLAWDQVGNGIGQQSGDASYTTISSQQYDANHEQTQTSLGTGDASLTFAFDVQHNVNVVTPVRSPSTVYHHDDFGRVERSTSPFTGTKTFQYDPAGNILTATDANGSVTTNTYDALNRLTQSVSTRSGSPTETVTWAYDNPTSGAFGIGRLESMTDPSGSTTYTYERRGMLASTQQIVGSNSYSTSYVYDSNGNRVSIGLPSGRTLTYGYDYADRQYSVHSAATTYISAASYEPFGPASQLVFGNGTTQTWTFDSRYWPSNEMVSAGSSVLSNLAYTENGAGFATGIADSVDSGYSRTFAYGGRARNMLTQAVGGAELWAGPASYSDTYNQNLAVSNFPGRNVGYSYNRQQTLTSLFNSSTGQTTNVTFDSVGNETQFGTSTYSYSPRELLASGDGVSYTYDGHGHRVSATASTGTRVSLYDPSMHLQSESSLSSGSIAYDYIWFAGRPVAQEDVGGQTHWTATDHLGAPFLQTTSTGTVYWQADYEPFGAIYNERTSDVHQPLRYPGQEAEEFTLGNGNGNTGRFYNGFRWYRPAIGRYTQPDPLAYAGGSFSLYAYAGNNPENFADPMGLCSNSGPGPCLPWIGCPSPADYAIAFGIGAGVGIAVFFALPALEIGFSSAFAGAALAAFAGLINNESGMAAFESGGTEAEGLGASEAAAAAEAADTAAGATEAGSSATDEAAADTSADGAAINSASQEADTGSAAEGTGSASAYTNTTDPGAQVTNITTDVTGDEAGSNLVDNGYTATSTADGRGTIYTNADGNRYIVRPSNSAPGGQAIDFFPSSGEPPVPIKINLGGAPYQP
jgi:RHS repeat-associated protein